MKRQKSKLPLDTIQSKILPRLPVESLARFRCVCKQWKSLFSTQEFIKLHMSRNHEKLLILDPSSRPATFHSIDCEPDYPATTLENVVPSEVNPIHMLLLASLDGLICVGFKYSRKLMLWNPVTGAYKYLPNSKYHGHAYVPHSDAIGFYYDSLDDCYKILHIDRTRSGSFYGRHYFQGERLIVISFDVNSEKFREIQWPSAKKCDRLSGRLVIVKDCIHLWVSYAMIRDSNLHTELDLWRLNGEQEWTKVSSICINDGYNYYCSWLHHEGLVNTIQRVMYIETLVSPHQGSKRHATMSLRPRKDAKRNLHATQ